jgi:DNA polymerase III subunit epsilon
MSDQPGYVDGKPQYEHAETVKQLKREKRYAEALVLLDRIMTSTEQESAVQGYGVAPWCYEEAALIHRKNGDRENEIAVLERFALQQHAPGVKPAKLLERLKSLKEQ